MSFNWFQLDEFNRTGSKIWETTDLQERLNVDLNDPYSKQKEESQDALFHSDDVRNGTIREHDFFLDDDQKDFMQLMESTTQTSASALPPAEIPSEMSNQATKISNLQAVVIVLLVVIASHLLSWMCHRRGSRKNLEDRQKERLLYAFNAQQPSVMNADGEQLGKRLLLNDTQNYFDETPILQKRRPEEL